MAKIIEGAQREQMILFPITLEDMITSNNEVRIIDSFINHLDIERLGFNKVKPNQKGTNHYSDADLLKLYIYSYRHKLRSSRKIEEQCGINVEVIWLMKGIKPNFRTISEFRKEHAKDIKKIFVELIKFCNKIGLINELQSQDGVKIKAVNSKEKNYTLNKLDDHIKRIEDSVERYLKIIDKNDKMEIEEENLKEKIKKEKEEYKELLKEKEELKKKLIAVREEIEEKGESQKSLTDEESRLMRNNGSFEVCYNNQVLVDTKNHIVTNYKADNNPADIGRITDITVELKEMLGIEEKVISNTTDQGYKDTKDMSRSLEKGIIPEVTLGKEQESYKVEFEYEENEITEEMEKSKKKEDITKCLRAGVIPKVYKEVLSEIKKEERTVYETIEEAETFGNDMTEEEKRNFAMEKKCYFKDKKSKKVYCPMGESLRKKSNKNGGEAFANKMACANCKRPCTESKYKEVVMKRKQIIVTTDKELRKEVNAKTKREKKRKLLITAKLTPKKEDTAIRMQTSEHVHGTMKRADDMSYFLLKGKEKVNAELGLYYIGSNIRRLTNMFGVETLLNKIEEVYGRKNEKYA